MSLQFITCMSWPWCWLSVEEGFAVCFFFFGSCRKYDKKCCLGVKYVEVKPATMLSCPATFQAVLALGHTLQNELSSVWGHFCRICHYFLCSNRFTCQKVTHGWLWGYFFSSFLLYPCLLSLFSQCGLQVWAAASGRQSPFYQWHCN